jgi:hypothetical protein
MDIKLLHRKAMEESDLAILARMKGDDQASAAHTMTAYELEAKAALALFDQRAAEPARSVLLRSAATLARDCGLFVEAEKLIYKALSGEPPSEIATELEDLLEQVSFDRHLELRGIKLGEEEMQMALTGKSVGSGMAPTGIFVERVHSTEVLLFRTAERTAKRPYRDKGRKDAKLAENFELFMSAPRAACFAVTFRVGGAQQPLPGLWNGEEIIDEMLECLKLFSQGKDAQLKQRIPEDAYFNNFVGLARSIQPDGQKVNMVGFTTVRRGKTKKIAMRKSSSNQLNLGPQSIVPYQGDKWFGDAEVVHLRGELLVANATKKSGNQSGEIQIVTSDKKKVKVIVPPGMMSDIVKPLWESEVEMTGTRKGNKIQLMQIVAAT